MIGHHDGGCRTRLKQQKERKWFLKNSWEGCGAIANRGSQGSVCCGVSRKTKMGRERYQKKHLISQLGRQERRCEAYAQLAKFGGEGRKASQTVGGKLINVSIRIVKTQNNTQVGGNGEEVNVGLFVGGL